MQVSARSRVVQFLNLRGWLFALLAQESFQRGLEPESWCHVVNCEFPDAQDTELIATLSETDEKSDYCIVDILDAVK